MEQMFAKLTSVFAVLCLMTNIVMGCATMVPEIKQSSLSDSNTMFGVAASMVGCHDTAPSKKGAVGQGSFCKAFCAALACAPSQLITLPLTHPALVATFALRDAPWHSGVDPPHPRLFHV